jgi:hypothetical protein
MTTGERRRAMVLAIALFVVAAGGCGSATSSPSSHTPSPMSSPLTWHKVFGVTHRFISPDGPVPTPVFRLTAGRVRVTATEFGGPPSGSSLEFSAALAPVGGHHWMTVPIGVHQSYPSKWTIGGELPQAIPAGRYVLEVWGNGMDYSAAVYQRSGP